MQSILSGTNGQKSVRLNVTRALSRLKSVFVTLFKPLNEDKRYHGRKRWNSFYSPTWAYTANQYNSHSSTGEFEFQLQLGSKLYPEYPIRSHAESYYQLRKTVGNHYSKYNTFDVGSAEYHDHKFIIGIDTEKVLEAGFTGVNTRAGDILNIRFDHNSPTAAFWAHEMHVILHSDNIMEIRDSGVTIFD